MTPEQKKSILATVPVLREKGTMLTAHFYNRMFRDNPELKNVFNMGNQQSGKQQTALANAVLAYAENIVDPAVLLPVIDEIGQKHTSLDIRPEHYQIVGKHLIASIGEVLGAAATTEIVDAWTAAYHELAELMSGYEADLYKAQTSKPNGWSGWRLFKVIKKEMESSEICSFYLQPADGGRVPLHQPGQYISLKLLLPELKMNQIRQYSISSPPDENYYRISVKRESGFSPDIQGMVSNRLHTEVTVGSFVELSAPAGNFVLPAELISPVVFISGGVGVTPFMSMIQHLSRNQVKQEITWIQGCRNETVHAFHKPLTEMIRHQDNVKQYIFYDVCSEKNKKDGIYEGIVDLDKLNDLRLHEKAHYFICGPSLFIRKQFNDLKKRGIDTSRIFFEEFGPQLLHLN